MIPVGPVDATFNVRTQGMDVCFDPVSQEQVLSFQFALTVSLPQVMSQLMAYQRRASQQTQQAMPGPAPGLAPPLAPPLSAPAQSMQAQSMQPPYHGNSASAVGSPSDAGSYAADMGYGHGTPTMRMTGGCQASGHMMQAAAAPPVQEMQPRMRPGPGSRGPPPAVVGPGSRGLPPGMAQEAIPDVNGQLISVVREKNTMAVRQLLAQKAEVNFMENSPSRRTPLQHALEAGGDVDVVNLLLQANSDVNLAMAGGMTACHYAIENYMSVPAIVIRMLLCSKADLNLADSRNMTALDSAKMVARKSFSAPGNHDQDMRVRQLLNEVTEQPTVAVSVVDASEVLNVVFADTVNDNIAFHTESALYLYSLKLQRVVFLKKLRQMSCRSMVRALAVNPELGTIAVCLEIMNDPNGESVQNVSIVWPNGQLTDEEPLKLSTPRAEGGRPNVLPACVVLSRCRGPQMLVCRFSNCEVYSWRLNAARSQLTHEAKLLSYGGQIATSDDGRWIAVENKEVGPEEGQVSVWCYESLETGPRAPKLIHTINKRPVALSVMQQDAQTCCLALVERSDPGHPLPPIEILAINLGGASTTLYRVRLAAPCLSLNFCHGAPTHLLSGHEDGLVIVYSLPDGLISLSHDGPGTRSISISSDRNLIASADQNYVRVYKVPPYEDP